MFPLRDSPRPERPPVVNWILVLANVAAFVGLAWIVPPDRQQDFAGQFGLVPARVRFALAHPGLLFDAPWPFLRDAVCPFFTAMFLHGSVVHLVSNVWFLVIFGDNVEGRLGHARYLAFYLLCGVMASVLHIASIPQEGLVASRGVLAVGPNPSLHQPMIGASGAIAGVLGAYIVMFPRSQILTVVVIVLLNVPAYLFLGLWFVGQFLMARSAALDSSIGVNVAYWAHVGGFVSGVVLGLLAPRTAPRRRDLFDSWRGRA